MKYALGPAALLVSIGIFAGDAHAQTPPKDDPHAAAFALLAGTDPVGVYKGYEALVPAGKADAAVPPRLAKMMWDPAVNATSRYWALRTLAELGPAAKPVLPDLARAMESTDPYFRLRGALGVLRAGGPAEQPVAALKALAEGKDAFVRMETFLGLGEVGPLAKDLLPFLTAVAGEAGHPDRALAVGAIGGVGPAAKGSVPLLVKLLAEPDRELREAAVRSLTRLAPDVPEAFQPLLKIVGEEGNEGHTVAEALARGGKAVVPALIRLLDGDNPIARKHAAHALRFMGRAATPAAEALARAVPGFRGDLEFSNAVRALGNLGPAGVPHLVGLLENPKVPAKYRIAEALEEIGPDAKPAVPALLALMKNPAVDRLHRQAAGEALAKIGPGAAEAVPDLIALVRDEKLDVKEQAIEALGGIGPRAADAVKPLVEALQADNRFGRYGGVGIEAAKALGRIGKPAESAIPVLVGMLSSDVAAYPAEALGRLGPAAKDALKPLRDLFTHDDARTRIAAALAVTRIDPDATDGIDALAGWLAAPKGRFREFEQHDAAKAIGAIGPRAKAALEPLRKALDHKTELSARAALAIYRISPGDAAALDSLFRTLASKDTFGPAPACDGLAEIGPAAKAALPELRRLALFHDGYTERDAARRAIRAIDPSQEP